MVFTRIKYSKGRPYLYLVESYREGGKVKQRHLQYLGPVNVNSKITEIKGTLQTSEFQEKEMQKRADWNQEGKREMYEREVKQEQEEQTRLKKKLTVYERHQKKLVTTINDKTFMKAVNQAYKKSDKLGSMVHVPDLTKQIQKETGLSKEQVHERLYEAYTEKKIDLQGGKGKESLKSPDNDATFQYMQPRGKLVTTKTKKLVTTFRGDLKPHFDQINKSGFKGGMVPIPEIWRKMKKDYSKKEFRQELLELEKKRVIDLQTASDPKLISQKDREGGFYLKDGGYYDHDERPGPTTRGYINYVVWRR